MNHVLLRAAGLAAGVFLIAQAAPTSPISRADLDTTVAACHDFYQFATGGWQKANPINPEYGSNSPWLSLYERNLDTLRTALEKASTSPDPDERRAGEYYAACMDTTRIQAAGAAPLQAELARINKIATTGDAVAEIGRLNQIGVPVFLGVGSIADPHNSAMTIADVAQSGLSLPDRDYYLKDVANNKTVRDALTPHITKMLTLAGQTPDSAAADAAAILALETKMAQNEMSRVDERDPQKVNNVLTVEQVNELMPAIGWTRFAGLTGLPQTGSVNVNTVEYLKWLNGYLAGADLSDVKAYLRWHYIDAYANTLDDRFVDEQFAFTKLLTGQQKLRPRWKRCVRATEASLGEAVGKVYVRAAFSPEAKAHALEVVDNLKAVLRDDIGTLPWMSAATRAQAIAKLDRMQKKIGYPDKARDYSSLAVGAVYPANAANAWDYEWRREAAEMNKPTNRAEWGMTAQTINAQYDPTNNDITFPAGILQPPFFRFGADDAVNYGAIGAVIGHEMTHGFDDEGRQYDANGNLRDWWTADDAKRFDAKAQCITDYYSSLPVTGDLKQNGKQVTGEAIADFGGATIAYKAYQRSLNGKPGPTIDGFTSSQRFFLAFAKVWAETTNAAALAAQGQSDVHAIARNRVVGTLSNMPEFSAAFACKDGDQMVRAAAQRCNIW